MQDNVNKGVRLWGDKVARSEQSPYTELNMGRLVQEIPKTSIEDGLKILKTHEHTSMHGGRLFDKHVFHRQMSKSYGVTSAEVIQTYLRVLRDDNIDVWELEDGFNVQKQIHRGIIHKILVHLSVTYEDRGLKDVWELFKAERDSCRSLLDVIELVQRIKPCVLAKLK